MPTLLLALMTACGPETPPPAPRPLDVVLVVVDTLRADALGVNGSAFPATPHLDRLAREEAASFSRAYTCASWTLPSVACLLTGLPVWRHGVVQDPADADIFGALPAEVPTVATILRARGYRAAAFVNNAFLAPQFGLHRGFEPYDYRGADILTHRSAQENVTAGLAWLRAEPSPSLLVLHLMEPHYDYYAPEAQRGQFSASLPHTLPEGPFDEARWAAWTTGKETLSPEDQAYVRARYAEEVLATDAALGALIEGLKADAARWERTLLVITADHGEELWDHGRFEHGHTTRSVVTRVPLLIKAPGVPPGDNRSVVSTAELLPLLTDGSGELAALARGGVTVPGRAAISEDILYGPPQLSIITDDLRFTLAPRDGQAWLWAVSPDGVEGALLSDDPAQRGRAEPLYQALGAARGGLNPTSPTQPVTVEDVETFEMLRSLGYVPEPAPEPEPAPPPPPAPKRP